jgi:hypothetical protein
MGQVKEEMKRLLVNVELQAAVLLIFANKQVPPPPIICFPPSLASSCRLRCSSCITMLMLIIINVNNNKC